MAGDSHLDDDLARLAGLVDRAEAIPRRHGDQGWADWLWRDAAQMRQQNLDGLRHFLHAFGGMGSLNDLGGERAFHDALDPVLEEAYALANSLLPAASQPQSPAHDE